MSEVLSQPEASDRVGGRQRNISEVLTYVYDSLEDFERSLAGCMALYRSLMSVTPNQETDERRASLPIFGFKAAFDAQKVIDVSVDLRNLPPEHVPHVLQPLIGATAKEMLNHFLGFESACNELKGMVHSFVQRLSPQTPPAAAPPTEPPPAADSVSRFMHSGAGARRRE